MPRPVAKKDKDGIEGKCSHMVQPPGAPPPPPKPESFSFKAKFGTNLSPDVYAENKNVAFVTSRARVMPSLIPTTGMFLNPPSSSGEVVMGSSTVYANGKRIARNGDLAKVCADPVSTPTAKVVARGTVYADD
jgi:uncharacterized Zn-binding protein involved in type VI secretion